MIKTIIFDMDGVLVNSEPLHHEVSLVQFKELNIEVTNEIFATFTGNSNKMIYQKIKDRFQLEHEIEDLIAAKNKLFIEAFDKKEDLHLMQGVKELIEDLYNNGMQLVVASSSEMEIIDKVFERFDLNRYFTHKVSGNDFPESKPNPAIFLKAAELAQTPVENCIVIEDSTNGIKAAKSAGIYCIAYKSEGVDSQDQSLADSVINDYKELNYHIIKNIN
ncbi:HAD family hydrolase [Flavobacterium aquatile]|uniref:ABC transporter ATP-binding protein n=1 Tax=Flavobacterium aquatile LMG 4008 = ATCC 11947 TaxID=1453498 RepID=A0A095TYE3_9FLAO|nr:HAD-IA family hydrolase [Flavobacterium aquatile]KGD67408.1 ABC transporter ATP-binding protein [Flavobacterium aquatile LMG 4008 = ATCC 11947]OXA66944.1 ABC transporter ATP-binding protein [Flavobacterium aquatile LMG 4008 = ATCC 11947]GEC78805.1 ABC transporter ATP-binding protein [Flavobacterium aquatile]